MISSSMIINREPVYTISSESYNRGVNRSYLSKGDRPVYNNKPRKTNISKRVENERYKTKAV